MRSTACRRCARWRIFRSPALRIREFPVLIEALAAVKEAAALANAELGLLDRGVADLIVRAAQEIRAGRHHEHFVVDMIQGGAGTSTNMNANEVIANRALELLGKRARRVHARASEQPRQPQPVDERRLSHRGEDRAAPRDRGAACGDGRSSPAAFLAKGEEFARSSRWDARSCRTPCR